jgi:hypothetical protein
VRRDPFAGRRVPGVVHPESCTRCRMPGPDTQRE